MHLEEQIEDSKQLTSDFKLTFRNLFETSDLPCEIEENFPDVCMDVHVTNSVSAKKNSPVAACVNNFNVDKGTCSEVPRCREAFENGTGILNVYSARGDSFEDVIETIQDNAAPVKTEPQFTGTGMKTTKDDTLKTTYDSNTGEFLVRIGELSYPVDIMEFAPTNVGLSESYVSMYNQCNKGDEYPSATPNTSPVSVYDNHWRVKQEPIDLETDDVLNNDYDHDHGTSRSLTNLDAYMSSEDYRKHVTDVCSAKTNARWSGGRTTCYQYPPTTTCFESNIYLYQQQLSAEILKNNRNVMQEDIRRNSTADPSFNSALRNDTEHSEFSSSGTSSHSGHSLSLPITTMGVSYSSELDVVMIDENDDKNRNCSEGEDDEVFMQNGKTAGWCINYSQMSDQDQKHYKNDATSETISQNHSNYATGNKMNDKMSDRKSAEQKSRPGASRKLKRSCRLWEFIRNLLLDPSTNPTIIRWENRDQGTFRLVQSKAIAHIWGMKKGNEDMNYEKLSRAMRVDPDPSAPVARDPSYERSCD